MNFLQQALYNEAHAYTLHTHTLACIYLAVTVTMLFPFNVSVILRTRVHAYYVLSDKQRFRNIHAIGFVDAPVLSSA